MNMPVESPPLDWTEIPGWLSRAEGDVLRSFATGKRVLELGSYLGRSTVCMAQVAEWVAAIDHHEGDEGTGFRNTWQEFAENTERLRLEGKIIPFVYTVEHMDSHVVSECFGMAFVDAAHDAPNVELCTRIALRAVKPGGVVFWHDWDRPSVREGVLACGVKPTAFLESLAWLTV